VKVDISELGRAYLEDWLLFLPKPVIPFLHHAQIEK
jgi:hypothetical protein